MYAHKEHLTVTIFFCQCIMLRENSHKRSDLTDKFVDIFKLIHKLILSVAFLIDQNKHWRAQSLFSTQNPIIKIKINNVNRRIYPSCLPKNVNGYKMNSFERLKISSEFLRLSGVIFRFFPTISKCTRNYKWIFTSQMRGV